MNGIHQVRVPTFCFACRTLSAISLILLFHFDLTSKCTSPSADRQDQPKISITTEMVVLPVNVTDPNGAFVSGLQKEQFRVYEDGRIQNVTLFAEEDSPVTAGILVDHSRSMRSKLSDVGAAVSTFARSSNPEDEMFVVDFNDTVSVQSLAGKPFTSDPRVLERAVSAVSAQGQTALYDAIAEGLKHLELGNREKKALIIVSDGGDNASRHKFSEVLSLARRAHAVIYSVGLFGSSDEENPAALEKLCRETGGIAFFPRPSQSISEIATAIARDIREQYTIGYAPPKELHGNSFRKIAVKVSAPDRGRLRVRTRTGYLASGGNPAPPQSGAGGR